MKFIDECNLNIKAGKGGNGIISFRREAKVPKGGPNGGDGGDGGSIFFVGDSGSNTLLKLKYLQKIKGNDGENGRHKDQFGAKGEDKFIKVPLGTTVYCEGKVIVDIVEEKEYLIAVGGNGGKGNAKFKSSKNLVPRICENGTLGKTFIAQLTLKVLADVGLVGKPSAGKSTLLSKLSNAKPKVAEYHFTTLSPQLGLVEANDGTYVVADLPGLIRGAALGKGLGFEFLKHIDRCRFIAHIVDFGDPSKNPIADYEEIRKELVSYSMNLEERPEIIIANKNDLESFSKNLKKFKEKYPDKKVVEISSLKEKGISQLKNILYDFYKNNKIEKLEDSNDEITITLDDHNNDEIIVEKIFEGMYEVYGKKVKYIYDIIPINTYDNLNRFNKKLKSIGVWKKLRKLDIKPGDTVRIFEYEFDWLSEEMEE